MNNRRNPNRRNPNRTTGAATGARRAVDPDAIFLLQCLELTGIEICQVTLNSMAILTTFLQLDFTFIGATMGISRDAARMRYSRIRQRIYAATSSTSH